MACRDEATDDDHGHSHSHGAGHAHKHDTDDGADSLFSSIDLPKVTCLNEREDNMCYHIFKPWSNRLDKSACLLSYDGDPELILHVPFTSPVQIKSFCVSSESGERCPTLVRCFVNRTDVDFASVQDIKATQTFHIAGADPDCEVYYVVQASRWQGVRSVTLFFEDSDGRDETAIHYIDFKGVASHLRREAVETVYETRPQSNELAGEADNFTHTSVL